MILSALTRAQLPLRDASLLSMGSRIRETAEKNFT